MKSIHRKEYRKLLSLLVAARKERGLTQAEVARKLKKPQSYIAKIEKGERRVDVIEFLQICAVLAVDYARLLNQIS